MSRAFAWIMLVISIAMLVIQIILTKGLRIPVTALWVLILVACIYTLFFKRRT